MSVLARILLYSETDQGEALRSKLENRGYQTIPAGDRAEAMQAVAMRQPDIAIVDTGSGSNGAAVGEEFQLLVGTRTMPTIIIGDDMGTAGANAGFEHLEPGFQDLELFSRLEALTRLVTMQEELSRRTETTRAYGLDELGGAEVPESVPDARILLLASEDIDTNGIEQVFGGRGQVERQVAAHLAMEALLRDRYDAVVVQVGDNTKACIEFCADVRSNSRLFNVPVLMIADGTSEDVAAAYAAGASEVVGSDTLPERVLLRVLQLVKLQRYREIMQAVYRDARHYATSDALTGLFSHGFLHAHLDRLIEDVRSKGKTLSVGMFILNNLDLINQTHGYVVGDRVLRQVGSMIGNLVRAEDLAARYSGSRFAVILPDTSAEAAGTVLHRIAGVINFTEFSIPDLGAPISVDLKAVFAEFETEDTSRSLLKRALAQAT